MRETAFAFIGVSKTCRADPNGARRRSILAMSLFAATQGKGSFFELGEGETAELGRLTVARGGRRVLSRLFRKEVVVGSVVLTIGPVVVNVNSDNEKLFADHG